MGTNYNASNTGVVRAGSATDNVTIGPSGVDFSGTSRPTKLLYVVASEFVDGASPASSSIISNATYVRNFVDAASTNIISSVIMPNDYESGTSVTITINWAPNSTGTGNVNFNFLSRIINDGSSITSSVTNPTYLSAAPGVNNQLTTYSGVRAMPGGVPGTTLAFRLQRSGALAADTYTGTARFLSLTIEYTSNSLG